MKPSRPSRAAHRGTAAAGSRKRGPIRIVVAMQARLDREGMAAMLRTQPDFEVLGGAGTSREVISLCLRLRPDVLILGILVPWPQEVSAVDAVRLCSPETQVLAIAPHSADRCAELNPVPTAADSHAFPLPYGTCLIRALAHGACGALDGDVAPEELFESVRAVARGERRVGPRIEVPESRALPLSKRERMVSIMVGNESSNKEIAVALRISEATVKKHIGHVLHELGLHDRLQLGLCVVRHPLIFATE